MAIETFDHTGDVGVRVRAATLDQLFGEAAVALTDVVTDASLVEERQTMSVTMTASERDLLLLDFLSDLLFRFDTAGWLTRRADVTVNTSRTPMSLEARLHGETFDPSRQGVKVLVKAVTYHELKVEHAGDEWRATVIFDI